jgi:hypothetical protein
MAALILLMFFLALGTLSVLGRTVDSRDPDYGLGRLIGGDRR